MKGVGLLAPEAGEGVDHDDWSGDRFACVPSPSSPLMAKGASGKEVKNRQMDKASPILNLRLSHGISMFGFQE